METVLCDRADGIAIHLLQKVPFRERMAPRGANERMSACRAVDLAYLHIRNGTDRGMRQSQERSASGARVAWRRR